MGELEISSSSSMSMMNVSLRNWWLLKHDSSPQTSRGVIWDECMPQGSIKGFQGCCLFANGKIGESHF